MDMKRWTALVVCLVLALSLLPASADKPKDVPTLSKEEIPDTPPGITNYLLLCVDSWGNREDASRGSLNDDTGDDPEEPAASTVDNDYMKYIDEVSAAVQNISTPSTLGNTDGMILVTVDTFMNRVILTSFVRDLLIQRPDGKFNRLSRFVPNNGNNQEAVEKLIDIYGSHFGIRIDHYIVVNWSMVLNIINAAGVKDENGVGRVQIELTKGEAEYLRGKNAYTSSWAKPALKGAGTYMLSPYAAVIYMRCRKSQSAINGEKYDYRRTTRARNVLFSLKDKLSSISYDQAMELLEVVVSNTLVTDMSTMDLLEAADTAFRLKEATMDQMRIPIDGTHRTISYSSGSCEEIDFVANREALLRYLGYFDFVVREDEE